MGTSYIGAIIGRYGNRIAKARFTLNNTEYLLSANESGNQLHGGPNGFDKRAWTTEVVGENMVRFALFSPDGENGYPGNLHATVTYTVHADGFRIDFDADSDADTVYAPTTHIYWNLHGGPDILGSYLQMNAKTYLPVDRTNIPTGEIRCASDQFDFSNMRQIEADYDHCFILDGAPAACVVSGDTRMTLRTDYPALQFYTGSGLAAPHGRNAGFALEPEYYPDSPNQAAFPSPVLRKGDHFHKYVVYRFMKVDSGCDGKH